MGGSEESTRLSAYSDLNLSALTHPCNVHFAVFNFAIHCSFEYKFNTMEGVNTVF